MVERDHLAVVAAVFVLTAGVAGATYVSDVEDPILGGGSETPTPTPMPTQSPTPAATPAGGSGGGGGGGITSDGGGVATQTPPAYDFRFRIVGTESCGNTCRDVTVRLTNEGTEAATGVTATSRILVEGDQIWKGTENIGTVDAGESVTRTKRVKLGLFDAAKVQRNGGYVTIKTTVRWDGGSRTFTQRVKAT